MHITQRRFTNVVCFEFELDTLKYSRSDAYGMHSLEVPYGSIGMDPRVSVERNSALFHGGIVLLFWGVAHCLYALSHADLFGLIFLLPGPVCLVLHALAKTSITYLDSDAGEIALLHDRQFEVVIHEIRERRKKQLMDWYGRINFANDPEEEIQKFHWLHSQRLISADQLHRIVTTIRNAATHEQDELDDPSLPHQ